MLIPSFLFVQKTKTTFVAFHKTPKLLIVVGKILAEVMWLAEVVLAIVLFLEADEHALILAIIAALPYICCLRGTYVAFLALPIVDSVSFYIARIRLEWIVRWQVSAIGQLLFKWVEGYDLVLIPLRDVTKDAAYKALFSETVRGKYARQKDLEQKAESAEVDFPQLKRATQESVLFWTAPIALIVGIPAMFVLDVLVATKFLLKDFDDMTDGDNNTLYAQRFLRIYTWHRRVVCLCIKTFPMVAFLGYMLMFGPASKLEIFFGLAVLSALDFLFTCCQLYNRARSFSCTFKTVVQRALFGRTNGMAYLLAKKSMLDASDFGDTFCALTTDQLFGVMFALEDCPAIEELDCRNSILDELAVPHIVNGLNRSNLKGLKLNSARLPVSDLLSGVHVSLSNSSICNGDGVILGHILKKAVKLQRLNLSHNQLGGSGMRDLGIGLKTSVLIQLILDDNPLKDDGAFHLSLALDSNAMSRWLAILSMNKCQITAKGFKALAGVLGANHPPRVRNFSFTDNPIGNRGAFFVGKILRKNKHLTSVNVQRCNISLSGTIAIADAIKAAKRSRLQFFQVTSFKIDINSIRGALIREHTMSLTDFNNDLDVPIVNVLVEQNKFVKTVRVMAKDQQTEVGCPRTKFCFDFCEYEFYGSASISRPAVMVLFG